MNDRIKQELVTLAEADYQIFAKKLLPGTKNILGVRLPNLRKIAKQIAKQDWRTYLATASNETFEEIMLQGMVIGYIKTTIDEILFYAAEFIPKIDNWSVCDSFCSGLKITKKYPKQVWNFIINYLKETKPYFLRFGIVMLIDYYIDLVHIEDCFFLLDKIQSEHYYVNMAIAWAVSVCYIRFPEKTISYLKNNNLSDWTYHKAIQKVKESYLVTEERKALICQIKRQDK